MAPVFVSFPKTTNNKQGSEVFVLGSLLVPSVPSLSVGWGCQSFTLRDESSKYRKILILQVHNFILQVYNFILQVYNFILQAYNFILQVYNFILQLYNFILQAYNFLLHVYNFILQVYNFILQAYNFILQVYNFILQVYKTTDADDVGCGCNVVNVDEDAVGLFCFLLESILFLFIGESNTEVNMDWWRKTII